jgi:hypothetical protein
MLRLSFSEDHASRTKNEHWCGAAMGAIVRRAANRVFLFQICTSLPGGERNGEGTFDCAKSLIGLGSCRQQTIGAAEDQA